MPEAEEDTAQPAEVWAEKTQEAMDHEKSEEDEKQDTWRMRSGGRFLGDFFVTWKMWGFLKDEDGFFCDSQIFSVWLLGLISIFVGGFWMANRFCSLLPRT